MTGTTATNGQPTENLSAVLFKKGDLRLVNMPIPEPKDDEVLCRMGSVGICGSDVAFWVKGCLGGDGLYPVTDPLVLGHEAAGTVLKVGAKVNNLKPGDRVAIEPGVGCRHCEYCKIGRYNLCADEMFCATPPNSGNISRYYTHPADFCYKLPDHVGLEEGALCEPIAVGVHTCRRAELQVGHTVFITGAGPIGLINMLVAKYKGASKVIMTDVRADRLEFAKELGADHTIVVDKTYDGLRLSKEVVQALGGQPDVSIDCSGAEVSLQAAIRATKSGGKVVLVGYTPPEITVPLVDAATREVDIRGVFRYANSYPEALAIVASGKVPVKKLITHNFTIEETLQAFETARTGAGGAIKVMIHC